jgi:hypothetical protein
MCEGDTVSDQRLSLSLLKLGVRMW